MFQYMAINFRMTKLFLMPLCCLFLVFSGCVFQDDFPSSADDLKLGLNHVGYMDYRSVLRYLPLKNGNVFIIGSGVSPAGGTELFDYKTLSFRPTKGQANFKHEQPIMAKLNDGNVFILSSKGIELYNPEMETFNVIPSAGLNVPIHEEATVISQNQQNGNLVIFNSWDSESTQATYYEYIAHSNSFKEFVGNVSEFYKKRKMKRAKKRCFDDFYASNPDLKFSKRHLKRLNRDIPIIIALNTGDILMLGTCNPDAVSSDRVYIYKK